MANNNLISRSALLEAYDREHEGAPGKARRLIEAAAFSPWADMEYEEPVDGIPYLLIVSGKPRRNITMHHAYMLGTWLVGEGWILDEYPEWEDPTVHAWAELPDPPEEAEVCEECMIRYSEASKNDNAPVIEEGDRDENHAP